MITQWETPRSCRPRAIPRRAPLRVAVLCSFRSPALEYLLRCDPNRGRLYDIVACVSSEAAFAGQDVAIARGIPIHWHPLRGFCEARGRRVTDRTARMAYDAVTVALLRPHHVDLVVLDAYLYLLFEPMLSRYSPRIINLHHSDLTLRDEDGHARYPGLRAVRDAILAGEHETRATAHLVTRTFDEGPPFLRSWAFPIPPLVEPARRWGATDMLKAYAYSHQEWMIRATWGPMMAAALALVADGRVDLDRLSGTGVDDHGMWEIGPTGSLRRADLVDRLTPARLMATAG
jgi:folate-dependent phosphoribosylglycinamide formyltransferase PurN